jgi:hypothetical protein
MAVIEFLCPNGHKIRCQADQAGRPAKCLRCGVRFRVPDPADLEASRSDAIMKPDLGELGLAGDDVLPTNVAPKKDAQMEFLCPNGHRLFGAASLAGRAGECPDCGARFRIPTYDEISLGEKASPDIPLSEPNPFGQANGQSNDVAPEPAPPLPERQAAAAARDRAEQAWEEEVMPATVWSVAAGTALADQPVATLFARLWTTRPKGARIELQLRDGEAIAIEQFMASLSQPSHGVFGVRAPDSTYTLMAIAWDTIARILVRGLLELPK